MRGTYDVFAETNPAFCAYALTRFTEAFETVNADGPSLSLSYIALPIALSGDLSLKFDGTNKNTGLLEWLMRCPEVQIELVDRVNGSMGIVTEAVRFSCFMKALTLDEAGRLRSGPKRLKKSAVNGLSEAPLAVIKNSERLGYWFAMAGSARTTFDMMGLTV
ncbi:three component ABC system middle component [Xanthomonas sp. BRIP62409]|uniref:three component ABC system middle component n=1 Tax=Xanthomonas sp. BRIP62409 TaxID=2182388 RepID=UPI000F8DC47B|nr:three component ABC system middle component [Xanthomonas sp. BRIP62409]